MAFKRSQEFATASLNNFITLFFDCLIHSLGLVVCWPLFFKFRFCFFPSTSSFFCFVVVVVVVVVFVVVFLLLLLL